MFNNKPARNPKGRPTDPPSLVPPFSFVLGLSKKGRLPMTPPRLLAELVAVHSRTRACRGAVPVVGVAGVGRRRGPRRGLPRADQRRARGDRAGRRAVASAVGRHGPFRRRLGARPDGRGAVRRRPARAGDGHAQWGGHARHRRPGSAPDRGRGADRRGVRRGRPGRDPAPVSYRHDVVALLSKAGCNMGACHGNLNGKGGFRLSLRGDDPAFDLDVDDPRRPRPSDRPRPPRREA